MRIPVGTLTSATLHQVAKRLSDVAAAVSAGWSIEHRPDGTHKTVTATGALYERGRAAAVGEWIAVPYASGNFTASGSMTWTVDAADVTTYAYTLVGKTMTLAWWIDTSTTGGVASSDLRLALPAGFRAARSVDGAHNYLDTVAGFSGTGPCQISAGMAYVSLFRNLGGTAWALSPNGVYSRGQLTLEVQ